MAIAYDNSVHGGLTNPGTSLTWSHTTGSGTNRIMFVGLFGNYTPPDISGVTYAGAAMTFIGQVQIPTDRYIQLYYLIAPASGANNVIITASASIAISGASATYTGANQSSQPDAWIASTAASSSLTTSITTIANNSWVFTVGKGSSATGMAGGTNATLRQFASGIGIMDSNGPITPASTVSTTFSATQTGSIEIGAVVASFSPTLASITGVASISNISSINF